MPKGRCTITRCTHVVDAEHWEDALEKLRSHFRLEHPTKVFPRGLIEQDYDRYNQTLEEYFEAYYPGQPINTLPPARITEVCRRMRRSAGAYNPALVQVAVVLAGQHGMQLDPYDPDAPADNPNVVDNGLVFVDVDADYPDDPGGDF